MPKKTITTLIQKVLAKIRPVWIARAGQELARGMEVRVGFEEQLARFFDLLDQSITTGDPAWMDKMTKEDLRALTPLIYSNVNPYGTIRLDMTERLAIEQAG